MKYKFFVIIFIAVIIFFPVRVSYSAAKKINPSNIDAQIAAEEKKREELSRQIQTYKRQIREMGAQVEGLLTKVNTLQQDENIALQELTVLELQGRKIEENIAILELAINEDQEKINELSDLMKDRILDMYKYRQSDTTRMLFASRSVLEAIEMAYMLGLINKRDEEILTQLQERMQNLELSHKTMDEQKTRLIEKTQATQEQREKYNKSIKETNNFIRSIQRKKSLAEKAALEAEQAQRAAGDMIVALRKKKASQKVDYLVGRGRGSMFDWPVRGKISSPYGYRIHPILKRKILHSGIDIAAPSGTPVKAAASGEVLFDGWLRGYGRVIILDHGRDFSTLYAHLAASLVKEGQVVRAGSTIARVGNTGNTTGYHLHFEVRKGKFVQNPLDYLKR